MDEQEKAQAAAEVPLEQKVKKAQKADKSSKTDDVDVTSMLAKAERRISELEQRLARLEKRTKGNEQFARTLSACLSTQIIGVDAVTAIVRRAIASDTDTHKELNIAIREYDKRKLRRWCSGFLGVMLWLGSITAAAVIGALIHWIFASA